jgi:DNA polymerase
MTKDTVTALDENTRRYYLDLMGIQCWELQQSKVESDSDNNRHVDTGLTEGNDTAWLKLEQDVQQCVKCQLHTTRKQAIPGRGNQSAELMFILLSPNMNDDESGILCSGEENELFAKMLSAINISINDVYISSLLKCCVPAQHTISIAELQYCSEHLKQQIQLVKPERLIVLGETAARCILQRDLSLDDLRALINTETSSNINQQTAGISSQYESVPLFLSYSPQQLLQQPENKRKAWTDLQQLQKLIEN